MGHVYIRLTRVRFSRSVLSQIDVMSFLVRQLNESGLSFMLDGKSDQAIKKQLQALQEVQISLTRNPLEDAAPAPPMSRTSCLIELEGVSLVGLPHTRGLVSGLLLNYAFRLKASEGWKEVDSPSCQTPEQMAMTSAALMYNMALISHRHYAVLGESVHLFKAQRSYARALSFLRHCRIEEKEVLHLYLATLTNLACTHCETGSVASTTAAVQDLQNTLRYNSLTAHEENSELMSILDCILAHCYAPAAAA